MRKNVLQNKYVDFPGRYFDKGHAGGVGVADGVGGAEGVGRQPRVAGGVGVGGVPEGGGGVEDLHHILKMKMLVLTI